MVLIKMGWGGITLAVTLSKAMDLHENRLLAFGIYKAYSLQWFIFRTFFFNDMRVEYCR